MNKTADSLGGGCLRHRHYAELLHHAEVVADAPVLDELAVFEPKDVDELEVDALPGRGHPHHLAGVRAMYSTLHPDTVLVHGHALYVHMRVRHAGEHHPEEALDCGPVRAATGDRLVLYEAGVDHVIHLRHVVRVDRVVALHHEGLQIVHRASLLGPLD